MKNYSQNKHRRSIRLKGFNYFAPGWYFITICCKNRELYFERYQKLKEIVDDEWNQIPNRYSHVDLDEYVIMPNHIHGIIIINDLKTVGATPAVAQKMYCVQDKKRTRTSLAPTVGDIVGVKVHPSPI